MRDADVFERDVEFVGAFHQVRPDSVRDCFTLSDEFCGVELGYYCFEDFVADGGKNALVVVCAEILQVETSAIIAPSSSA